MKEGNTWDKKYVAISKTLKIGQKGDQNVVDKSLVI